MKTKLGVSRCCCDPSCTVFVPCCLRQLEVGLFIEVSGAGTDVYTERFTLTNNCNAQTSVDWSSFELVGTPSGGTTITHSGMPNQGCTYGIDVLLEHLFCSCSGVDSNFTAVLRVCNPHNGNIDVNASAPSMSASFAIGELNCIVPSLNDFAYPTVTLAPGAHHDFVMEFGVIDWKNCPGTTCIANKPLPIVKGDDYINDQYDTTCITPLGCAPGDVSFETGAGNNPSVDDCLDVLCPPCGCTADLDETIPVPSFVGYTTANGLGAVTPAIPTGAADNDILLLHINGEGEDTNPDLAPSDDWKHIDELLESSIASATDGAADRTRQTIYWTRYDSTATPNMTVPDAGTYTLAVVTCWRNCLVVDDPIDTNAKTESFDDTNDTTVSVTGITTVTPGTMVVSSHTSGDNVTTTNWVNASLASITQRVNEATAVGSGGHIGVASGIKTNAGLVSASTADVSDSEEEANWMLALRRSASTWAAGSGCRCGCGAAEARRSCKVPKDELIGMSEDTGEITFCDDFDSGVHAQGIVIIFITPGCKRTGDIRRNGDSWYYTRTGIYDPPGGVGPLVSSNTIRLGLDIPITLSCTDYQVEWNRLGASMQLDVAGQSTSIVTEFFTFDTGGVPYLVAQSGSTYTVEL